MNERPFKCAPNNKEHLLHRCVKGLSCIWEKQISQIVVSPFHSVPRFDRCCSCSERWGSTWLNCVVQREQDKYQHCRHLWFGKLLGLSLLSWTNTDTSNFFTCISPICIQLPRDCTYPFVICLFAIPNRTTIYKYIFTFLRLLTNYIQVLITIQHYI